jgi:hypothetical protein
MLLTTASAVAQNQLVNGDFESPAVLSPGQTDVPAGGRKHISLDQRNSSYSQAISGVFGWTSGLNADRGSDSGIARDHFLQGTRSAFINNWERRLSQATSVVVTPGTTYRIQVSMGMFVDYPGFTPSKAGRLSLVAGDLSPANADLFSPGSIVLREMTAATPSWTQWTPSLVVPYDRWGTLAMEYTAPSSGPMIGKNLVVSLRTEWASVGVVWYDNASLVIVPAPSAGLLLPAILIGCSRRRRVRAALDSTNNTSAHERDVHR